MNQRNRAVLGVGAVLLVGASAAVSGAWQAEPAGSVAAGGAAQARQAEQITVYRSPG